MSLHDAEKNLAEFRKKICERPDINEDEVFGVSEHVRDAIEHVFGKENLSGAQRVQFEIGLAVVANLINRGKKYMISGKSRAKNKALEWMSLDKEMRKDFFGKNGEPADLEEKLDRISYDACADQACDGQKLMEWLADQPGLEEKLRGLQKGKLDFALVAYLSISPNVDAFNTTYEDFFKIDKDKVAELAKLGKEVDRITTALDKGANPALIRQCEEKERQIAEIRKALGQKLQPPIETATIIYLCEFQKAGSKSTYKPTAALTALLILDDLEDTKKGRDSLKAVQGRKVGRYLSSRFTGRRIAHPLAEFEHKREERHLRHGIPEEHGKKTVEDYVSEFPKLRLIFHAWSAKKNLGLIQDKKLDPVHFPKLISRLKKAFAAEIKDDPYETEQMRELLETLTAVYCQIKVAGIAAEAKPEKAIAEIWQNIQKEMREAEDHLAAKEKERHEKEAAEGHKEGVVSALIGMTGKAIAGKVLPAAEKALKEVAEKAAEKTVKATGKGGH